jgi:hypothetical protein
MKSNSRSILAVALTTAVATLAACGGGGGSDAPPPAAAPAPAPATPLTVLPPQIVATLPPNTAVTPTGTTAAVKFASDRYVTVLGASGWKLFPIATTADGSILSGKTFAWTSSASTVATVAADGTLTPVAVGTTTVTASLDGKSAQVLVEVKARPTTLAQLKDLLPFTQTSGKYKVASDYSAAVSQQHLDNLVASWDYFKRIYPLSVGDHTEVFITQEKLLITQIASTIPECSQSIVSAQLNRVVLSCYDPVNNNNNWFVAPQTLPDFSIAQGEESQAFLIVSMAGDSLATPPVAALPVQEWPWLMEGIAYAHESGTIGAGGTFTVSRPSAYLVAEYKKRAARNALLPLSQLTALTSQQFTDINDWGNHAQAAMLFTYIERTSPGTIKKLIDAMRSRTVSTNAQALSFLTTELATTPLLLDEAYRAFGASL